MKQEKVKAKSKNMAITILPLRDFRIAQNKIDIQLIEGQECEIPPQFVENLKTEKVI